MWRRFTRARRRDAATALIASALTTLASGGIVAASAATPQAPPRNEQAPTISGVQRVGSGLTGNPGTWSGRSRSRSRTSGSRVPPRWRTVAASTRIAATRRGRRTRTAADLHVVEARNRDGARTAQASTGVIGARATAPRNVVAPSISGTAREGRV